MIFEDIEQFESMDLKERSSYFGKSSNLTVAPSRRRSNMMLNPLRLKHLNHLDTLEADVVTLNLEDAIAPSRKREALINIALALSNLKNRKSQIVIRTNPIDAGGREEIEYLLPFPFDAIRIPKVKSVDEVKEALDILPEEKELHLSIETKEAFKNLSNLKIDSRVTTVNLGILDLLADMNLPQSLLKEKNPKTVEYILSRFLVESGIAGFLPVSFMFQEYRDIEGFKRWLEVEKSIGFTSKACMGPAQVEIVNSFFGVTKDELTRAKEIKEAFEANSKIGENGFMHKKYGFIDEPIYRDALNILRDL